LANLDITTTVDLSGVYTMIEDCCACGPIPLFQTDADQGGGQITLTMTGLSYCLAENITGTIVISASDVTVNGEEHILTGRVVINAPNAIVHNAKIKAQAPVVALDAFNGAVNIGSAGSNAQILNCLIESVASGSVRGRTGISSDGQRTIIKNCNVSGGNSSSGVGGTGISLTGSNSVIEDTIVRSGDSISSFGTNAIISSSNVVLSINNVTAIGGNTVSTPTAIIFVSFSGAFTSIRNSIVTGVGTPGILIQDGVIDNVTVAVSGGTSGGIRVNNSAKCSITNSKVIASSPVSAPGGIGIEVLGSSHVEIDAVEIQGGSGTSGGQGVSVDSSSSYVSIVNSNVTAGSSTGAGSLGVDGIRMLGSNGLIDNVTVTAGNGTAGSFGSGGAGGSAIIVAQSGNNTIIKNSTATAGNGGAGDPNTGNGGIGGDGINISVSNGSVIDTVVKGGNGGNSTFDSTNAGAGGNGIVISASNIVVEGLTATGGTGGIGDSGGLSIVGGNGGNGIRVIASSNDVNTVVIKASNIVNGGVGGASAGTAGTPGNGGHGIFVYSPSATFNVNDVQIRDCTISNVGQATAPGIGGDGIRIESFDPLGEDRTAGCVQIINNKIVGSGGNGCYILRAFNIEVKDCSASCNGICGFAVDDSQGIIFDSLNVLSSVEAGIRAEGPSLQVQIKNCKVELSGGDGIHVSSDETQVISCCSTSNTGIGINNQAGSLATYYNNAASDNFGGNYSGVSLVRIPGPQTGFYTNVSEGVQDCDLCGLFTAIEDACGSTPLFQSDVDIFGEILLFNPGNYCLAENITGNISVSAANITIDGNGYALTGYVDVQAANVIVKNLTITPPAPANSGAANFSAIFLRSGADNAQILNCVIICANTIATNVPGRPGISGFGGSGLGNKTLIKDCNITAGSGNGTGAGGSGIIISGQYASIVDSVVIAGAGGSGGGTGGTAVQLLGSDGTILNSELIGGNGGNSATVGGIAGLGVLVQAVSRTTLTDLTVVGGNGGTGGSGNGGAGSAGIEINGSSVVIVKGCSVIDRNNGGNSTSSTGGAGGHGIFVSNGSVDVQISECRVDRVGAGGTGGGGGVPGNGIRIASGTNAQVVSNRVSDGSGIGINNLAGTAATFYNNISTDNTLGNYSGVSLIRVPGPQTGFYTNVTQGAQDCDLCNIFTVLTVIEDDGACGSIPLFQSNVVGGAITLSTPGLSYCLAENITGTIVITGANITVNGNNHVINGRVLISGIDAIFKDAKVVTPAATNNVEAGFGGIHATGAVSNVRIVNCLVQCAASVGGVNARSGIFSIASNTVIEGCNATAGSGVATGVGIHVQGANSTIENSVGTGAGDTQSFGVYIQADNGLIKNSTGFAAGNISIGVEIQGNNGLINDSIGFGTGGTLGVGIQIATSNGLVKNSTGNGVGTGTGQGVGISVVGTSMIVKSCSVLGGSAGILVNDSAQDVQICKCNVTNTTGNGIVVATTALGVQVISNRVVGCGGIGINNFASTAKFGNNVSTENGTNYGTGGNTPDNVPLPGLGGTSGGPSYWSNVF
jgi:hypothetical protein